MKKAFFIILICLSVFFRFYNLNWDDNHHLHPDERFLTMVGIDMKVPSNFSSYLDADISTFNPRNLNQGFFVYGTFPLIFNKLIAVILDNDNYNSFTIQGRFLSAFFDSLTIILVIKFAEIIQKKYKLNRYFKYWAGIFYGFSVLMIQLSHFFTSDIFTSFFGFASFFFAFKFGFEKKNLTKNEGIFYLVLSGVFFGLGMASKINVVFILPIIILMIAVLNLKKIKKSGIANIYNFALFFLIAYFVMRIADPYFFQSNNIFNPMINQQFIENLKTLKSWEGADVWFPPAIQWIPTKPVIFALKNLVVFGYGIVSSALLLTGIIVLFFKAKNNLKKFNVDKFKIFCIALWCILFFLYQSIQFTKALRYFIFLYPFLAIGSAMGVVFITDWIGKISRKNYLNNLAINLFIIILILIWPLMFMSIYVNKHSRVIASEWMYRNLPSSNKLLNELWDDPLPLQVSNNYNKYFFGEMVPIFDPDSQEKWQKINQLLSENEYYILSSNRGWGSMPKVPKKYPQTTIFYNQLIQNQTQYKKIADFSSYPSLRYLGIPLELNDDWADETFTVYDHPRVMIFRKE